MPDSTLAGIITASASVFTALALLVTAIGVLIPNLRETRKAVKATEEVHIMVNQQRTDILRYQAALVSALQKAGIDVPADQSIPPAEGTRADKRTH